MSSIKLTAEAALDHFDRKIGELSILELGDQALVSLAIPNDQDDIVEKALAENYKAGIPKVGQSTHSTVDNTRFLGLQSEQFFALFDYSGDRPAEHLSTKLGDTLYLCDQSDSWIMLRLTGVNCRPALERICPIDLHPGTFPCGAVARTSMEHLAAIIVHEDENQYLLLSPRSSARSFLHAITRSIDNIS